MTTPRLTENAFLTISESDLLRIVSEHFCDSYGPFRQTTAISIAQDDNNNFGIEFAPTPEEGEEA